MTINPYFDSNFNATEADQALLTELTEEMIQSRGRDYHYLPRTLQNFDEFFGEDSASLFKDVCVVEMYLETLDRWDGERDFISKFGLEIHDEAKLQVSRKRWQETVQAQFGINRPREGDIIVFPKEIDDASRPFEIVWVEDEPQFFQLGDLMTFQMKVRTFEYSGEEFDTGIDSIDSYNEYNYSQRISIDTTRGTGAFAVGEFITQGSSWKAIVISVEDGELVVSANVSQEGLTYNPDSHLPIIGESSGAQRYMHKVEDDIDNMHHANNDEIDKETHNLIVSEYNPHRG